MTHDETLSGCSVSSLPNNIPSLESEALTPREDRPDGRRLGP